jgi:site-specific recombinase XerD
MGSSAAIVLSTRSHPIRSYAASNRELAEGFERYCIVRGFSEQTLRAYMDSVNRFVESLGSTSALNADRNDVRKLQAEMLKRGLCANSIQAHTAALRGFYKFLRLDDLTTNDPTLLLSYRKLPSRLPRVLLTVKEVDRMVRATETPLETAIVEVLYSTGVRVAELVAIRVEDIKFVDPGVIRIKQGKGNKDRNVYFVRKAADAIRAYLGDRRSGFLFEAPARTGAFFKRGHSWHCRFHENGRRHKVWLGRVRDSHSPDVDKIKELRATGLSLREIAKRTGLPRETTRRVWHRPDSYRYLTEAEARVKFEGLRAEAPGFHPMQCRPYPERTIRQIVYRLASRANIPGVHPHAFRRAFATHMLERDADLRVVQELLGHESLSSTMRYLNLSVLKLKEVHERCHPRSNGDNHGKKQ